TIYTVYPPAGTAVTSFVGTGCQDFQAYHYATTTPGGVAVIYAVTPRCAFTNKMLPLDYTTWGQSHEIVEAATDPFYDQPAYRQDDPTKGQVGENADLCTGFPLVVEGHTVTANWSLKAAKADERPCVPAPPGPMFGLAPASPSVTMAAGASKDVDVTAYSNAPMPAFAVLAYAETLDVTPKLSAKNGSNGDVMVVHLTTPANASSGDVRVVLYAASADYHTSSSLLVHVK
ncbi:MAG: hemagglutinin protein, partial [Myxococcaceae bacterium]|nr:hemagglutinin protein [Myxococcaceae bacterium]